MYALLLAILILDAILLMVVVLLQSGKGGGLAAMGGGSAGTDSLIGGRQAATLLTKSSWWLGGIFLTLSLVLAILSSRAREPESILRSEFEQAAPAAPQPVLPGVQPSEEGGAAIPGTEGAAPVPEEGEQP